MATLRDDPTVPALKQLLRDHRRIRTLLRRVARARRATPEVVADATAALAALEAHAAIEERLLYPALRATGRLVDAAVDGEVAHDHARRLAADLRAMDAADERYLATVRLLQRLVDAHILDEEDRLFPLARARDVDLRGVVEAFAAGPGTGAAGIADASTAAGGDAHRVRPPDSPSEQRQRQRAPGRGGAH